MKTLTEQQYNDKICASSKIIFNITTEVEYVTIKPNIKAFDAIAFRGSDFVSDLISVLENYESGIGVFTHIGMVVTSEILPCFTNNDVKIELIPGKLYLFESTFTYSIPVVYDSAPEVATGCGYFGCQLRDLDTVISTYLINSTTKAAWCPLVNNPLTLSNQSEIQEKFSNIFHEYYHRCYQMDPINLLAVIFPSFRYLRTISDEIVTMFYEKLNTYLKATTNSTGLGLGLKTELEPELELASAPGPAGWQFCSQLLANVYQEFGLIPNNVNTADILPIDFFGPNTDTTLKQNDSLLAEPVFIAKIKKF